MRAMSLLLTIALLTIASYVSGQQPIPISEADKEEIVGAHNLLRSQVQPPATNMEIMEYNDELARIAQDFSQQCVFDHNDIQSSASFSSIGENLLATTGTNVNYTSFVYESWGLDEKRYYGYGPVCCDDDCTAPPDESCGHYRQTIWHSSASVGCGIARCSPLENKPIGATAIYFVCNYGPAGNTIGQLPYMSGTSCANCPSNKQFCIENLCTEEAPPPSPPPTTSLPPSPLPATSLPPSPPPATSLPPSPPPTTSLPPSPPPTTSLPPPIAPTTSFPPSPPPTTSLPPPIVSATLLPPPIAPTTSLPPPIAPATSLPPPIAPTTSLPPPIAPTTSLPPPIAPTTSLPPSPPPIAPTTSLPPPIAPATSLPPSIAPTPSPPPSSSILPSPPPSSSILPSLPPSSSIPPSVQEPPTTSSLQPSPTSAAPIPTPTPVMPTEPLEITFINDSPRVQGNNISADIESNMPVISMICALTGMPVQDCSTGSMTFTNVPPFESDHNRPYILRVIARTADRRRAAIRRVIRIEQPGICTVHLINNGVTISGDTTATLEFASTGPATMFVCALDNQGLRPCSSGEIFSDLAPGEHRIKIVPADCGRNRRTVVTRFIME